MIKKTVSGLCVCVIASLFTFVSHATTSTAWYKVDDVKAVLKLIDIKCIDDKANQCQRTKHWRVYYKATSRYSPVQMFQELIDGKTPQVGAVMQMTVNVETKKRPL